MLSQLRFIFVVAALLGQPLSQAADLSLRIAVLDNAPPMAFHDADHRLTGFSVDIARALCEEMKASCEFHVTTLDRVVDALGLGEYDIAAVSLLDTPERRRKILFAKPYFRSLSLWFAKPGIPPGQPGIRIAVLRGSAQEAFAQKRGWDSIGVSTHGQLGVPLAAGIAQAAIIPMITSLHLRQDPAFQKLELVASVLPDAELKGDACFGITPRRPELKEAVDAALERIKRNGVYDRINSQFLPFRVN